MDELELLKRDWQKKNESFKQMDENEIANMQHKSSSSSVKWIFYISIIEFVVLGVIGLVFSSGDSMSIYEKLGLGTFIKIFTIINYIVLVYFIYKFYSNYKKINTFSSVKELMENIINARKTLKYYVNFNLISVAILGLIVTIFTTYNDPQIIRMIEANGEKFRYIFITIMLVFFAIAIFIMWLFYKLLYGFLIKRLNKNYKELQKIE